MQMSHLAFFSLMMTFLSFWIHKSAWLWGAFLAISYILAINTSVVQPFSLVPIGTLLVLFWLFKNPIHGGLRLVLGLTVVALAAGLNFHWIPGFCNWHVSGNFWVNYDKPFIGLFTLAFLLPLLRTPEEWYKMAFKAIPLTIVAVFTLAILAVTSGTIAWQFKIPSHFILRLATNLLLVVIPEEAFFRGFVQEELFKGLGKGLKGGIVAIVVSSLLFALFHLGWHSSFAMLGFVCLAGVIYGAIYQYTRAIESSILCHFAVNFIHMTFFTYHAE
jgi:membrane protease YdiL (CAAX protease family)